MTRMRNTIRYKWASFVDHDTTEDVRSVTGFKQISVKENTTANTVNTIMKCKTCILCIYKFVILVGEVIV